MPVHIHSSLGVPPFLRTLDADVRNLEPVLTDVHYFGTQFVLIHGGMPFTEHAAYLALKPHVWFDISAMPFLYTVPDLAAVLRKAIVKAPGKVLFGPTCVSRRARRRGRAPCRHVAHGSRGALSRSRGWSTTASSAVSRRSRSAPACSTETRDGFTGTSSAARFRHGLRYGRAFRDRGRHPGQLRPHPRRRPRRRRHRRPLVPRPTSASAATASPRSGDLSGAAATPHRRHAGWWSPPASSTCSASPSTTCSSTTAPPARSPRASPPRSPAKGTRSRPSTRP